MVGKSLLLLTALAALALAAPAEEPNPAKPQDNGSLIEDGVDKVYRFLQECGQKDMFFCMKMRALTYIDRAVSSRVQSEPTVCECSAQCDTPDT